MATYQGWKNRATWNVSLYVNNEEWIYRAACEFMKTYKGRKPYAAFASRMFAPEERTPDGFKWHGKKLCYRELNEMMRDLIA